MRLATERPFRFRTQRVKNKSAEVQGRTTHVDAVVAGASLPLRVTLTSGCRLLLRFHAQRRFCHEGVAARRGETAVGWRRALFGVTHDDVGGGVVFARRTRLFELERCRCAGRRLFFDLSFCKHRGAVFNRIYSSKIVARPKVRQGYNPNTLGSPRSQAEVKLPV